MSQLQSVIAASRPILSYVNRSIHAEQVFCSIVTQMTFLPQFSGQQALKTVHAENYETSYHRNTAAGNLYRLITEYPDNQLVLMTVECFIEARRHDKTAEAALAQITAETTSDAEWLTAARFWHGQRKRFLKEAGRLLYAAIGPEVWQQGAALAE